MTHRVVVNVDLAESATNRLGTARLALRELTPEQVAVLLDPDATSEDWVTGYPLPGSKNAATGFGRRGPDDMRRGFGMYHIVRASDRLVVGEVDFISRLLMPLSSWVSAWRSLVVVLDMPQRRWPSWSGGRSPSQGLTRSWLARWTRTSRPRTC